MDTALIALLFMITAMSVFAGIGWRKYRDEVSWEKRRRQEVADRLEAEEAARVARWSPKFVTSSFGTTVEIQLVRTRLSRLGSAEINSLTVGEVNTEDEGWERQLDELVISARARMAELNAFIDSYTGTVS